MAKDPAFLFYSKDFLTGVAGLTMEERGQYITLLCLQHQTGHLSEKQIMLSVGNAPADVRHKFRQDSAGLWYNDRLEIEIEKRKKFSQDQSERAKSGWDKRRNQSETKENTQKRERSRGNAGAMPGGDVNAIVNGEGNSDMKGVKGETKILLPFESVAFREKWEQWREYRRQIKKPYRSPMSEQAALRNLTKFTEVRAIEMIDQSIANQWQGIFELKENGTGSTKVGKQQHLQNLAADYAIRHGSGSH